MKVEIIYTEQYALIVSDEIPNGFYYDTYLKDLRHTGSSEYGESSITKKVIAHRPLSDAPVLEGVPLMPKFTQEDDVEKKSRDFVKEIGGSQDQRLAFVDGYLEAKETYKYTEEDLRKAFQAGESRWGTNGLIDTEPNEDEIIQSLQPKRPKYFECEIARITKFNGEPDYFELNSKPNSQNQIELVGEYIF
jgi:hypothetical protein